MKQILETLVELQRVDAQLLRLDNAKGDLPHQVERLNRTLQETEEVLKTNEKKLLDYKREVGIIEMELKALEGKRTKYQNQLYEVKTNREYDAVTHEIEFVKSEIGKKEDRLKELKQMVEELEKVAKETQEQLHRLKSEYEQKKAELEKKKEVTEQEEIALQDKRKKLLASLTPKMVAGYERIKKAKNGIAIVPVIQNACGGCHKKLPPQHVVEIREKSQLYFCDGCGRMLVWDDEVSEQANET